MDKKFGKNAKKTNFDKKFGKSAKTRILIKKIGKKPKNTNFAKNLTNRKFYKIISKILQRS